MKVESVPWARGKHRLTRSYAWFLARWAKRLSCKEVAEVFHTSWDTVFGAVCMAVEWGRAHHDLGGIEALGIDKIAWQRGHRFLTVVYQIDAHCKRLLWVGRERKSETLHGFFDWFGPARTEAVEIPAGAERVPAGTYCTPPGADGVLTGGVGERRGVSAVGGGLTGMDRIPPGVDCVVLHAVRVPSGTREEVGEPSFQPSRRRRRLSWIAAGEEARRRWRICRAKPTFRRRSARTARYGRAAPGTAGGRRSEAAPPW